MGEKSVEIKVVELIKSLLERGVTSLDISNILSINENIVTEVQEGKYDSKLKEAKEDYIELKSDYDSLKVLYERLGEKLALIANESMEIKKELLNKEKEYSELAKEVLFMKQDKKRMEFYCNKATDEAKELKEKVNKLNVEIIEVSNTSTLLENDVFNLEREKIDIKQGELEKYNRLRDDKAALERDIVDLKSEVNIKDNKILEIEQEVIRLKSRIKVQEEEIETKDGKIEELEEELDESNESIAEIEEQNIMLEKHIKKINERKFMGLFKKKDRE